MDSLLFHLKGLAISSNINIINTVLLAAMTSNQIQPFHICRPTSHFIHKLDYMSSIKSQGFR